MCVGAGHCISVEALAAVVLPATSSPLSRPAHLECLDSAQLIHRRIVVDSPAGRSRMPARAGVWAARKLRSRSVPCAPRRCGTGAVHACAACVRNGRKRGEEGRRHAWLERRALLAWACARYSTLCMHAGRTMPADRGAGACGAGSRQHETAAVWSAWTRYKCNRLHRPFLASLPLSPPTLCELATPPSLHTLPPSWSLPTFLPYPTDPRSQSSTMVQLTHSFALLFYVVSLAVDFPVVGALPLPNQRSFIARAKETIKDASHSYRRNAPEQVFIAFPATTALRGSTLASLQAAEAKRMLTAASTAGRTESGDGRAERPQLLSSASCAEPKRSPMGRVSDAQDTMYAATNLLLSRLSPTLLGMQSRLSTTQTHS